MGLVFLIVIGGVLGWLAAIIARANSRAASLRNMLIGIAGALVAGLAINPLIGGSNLLEGHYAIASLITALAGAMTVLLAANLWPAGTPDQANSSKRFQQGSGRNDAPLHTTRGRQP